MRSILLISLVLVAQVWCLADTEIQAKFEDFKKTYNKHYSAEEEPLRYGAFAANLREYELENAKATATSQVGITQFSDMFFYEWSSRYLHPMTPTEPSIFQKVAQKVSRVFSSSTPKATLSAVGFDWRAQGNYLLPPLDQASCGCCYAFASTAAVEAMITIFRNKTATALGHLSPQQVLNCGTNSGCSGGTLPDSYTYYQEHDLVNISTLPYSTPFQKKTCVSSLPYQEPRIAGYEMLDSANEPKMAEMVPTQPITALVDANSTTFQSYTSGVIDVPCTRGVNHVVLIVGYGFNGSTPIWIIKNSWGTTWGYSGYGYVKRSETAGGVGSICIATEVHRPLNVVTPFPYIIILYAAVGVVGAVVIGFIIYKSCGKCGSNQQQKRRTRVIGGSPGSPQASIYAYQLPVANQDPGLGEGPAPDSAATESARGGGGGGGATWTCPNCTLTNSSASVCAACGARRSQQHTIHAMKQ